MMSSALNVWCFRHEQVLSLSRRNQHPQEACILNNIEYPVSFCNGWLKELRPITEVAL